jgi:hypothetical protein
MFRGSSFDSAPSINSYTVKFKHWGLYNAKDVLII